MNQKPKTSTGRWVYVCHPLTGGDGALSGESLQDTMARNIEQCRRICAKIVGEEGHTPIAPQVYLPHFIDEETARDLAMDICLQLLGRCHEVRVYGSLLTPGMVREIEHLEMLRSTAEDLRYEGVEIRLCFEDLTYAPVPANCIVPYNWKPGDEEGTNG